MDSYESFFDKLLQEKENRVNYDLKNYRVPRYMITKRLINEFICENTLLLRMLYILPTPLYIDRKTTVSLFIIIRKQIVVTFMI